MSVMLLNMVLAASAPLLAEPAPSDAASVERGFLFEELETDERTYRYAVYVPRVLPEEPRPVIVFLHGRGESGTDGSRQLAVGLGEGLMWDPARWPFIVLMPQKPDYDSQWEDHEDAVLRMLDSVLEEHGGDPERVYLTGLSQGGHGTWIIGSRHPERFAAVAPICGYVQYPFRDEGGEPKPIDPEAAEFREVAESLRETPVWIFHGANDPVVPAANATAMQAALEEAGNKNVRLSIYPGVGHDSWTPAYAEAELPGWLLGPTPAASEAAPQP